MSNRKKITILVFLKNYIEIYEKKNILFNLLEK